MTAPGDPVSATVTSAVSDFRTSLPTMDKELAAYLADGLVRNIGC
jgi:hypothetical protein